MAMAGLGMAPASPTSSASSAGPAESGRTSVDISVPPPSTLFNPSFNGRRRVTDAGTKLGHSTLGTKGTFCSKYNPLPKEIFWGWVHPKGLCQDRAPVAHIEFLFNAFSHGKYLNYYSWSIIKQVDIP